jgi:hypothetical protein
MERVMFLLEEAEHCRSLANSIEDKLERRFLFDAAIAFEELAGIEAPWHPSGRTATAES